MERIHIVGASGSGTTTLGAALARSADGAGDRPIRTSRFSHTYKRINVHWIEAERQMKGLGVSSKLNARMDFLLHLKAIRREVADTWIATHFDAVGQRSTIDIREKFL